ncbi:MAG: hypothetical protein WC460_02335 [Patescibacteria group bacterium]
MRRLLFIITILSMVLSPAIVLASPGTVDQYGAYICQEDCAAQGLEAGQTYFFNIPTDPSFLSGYLQKPATNLIFYKPFILPEEITNIQESISDNATQLNGLTQNSEIDARFCAGSEVFGKGWYDSLNRARIKPICANNESIVKTKTEIKATDYYGALSISDVEAVSRVYHYQEFNNKIIFTDRPDISELVGKVVQGATDQALYYVNRYDAPLTLRPITADKAAFYAGADYQSKILYFDDSIVYSYKIGKPLY